jgi:hypothetical protein
LEKHHRYEWRRKGDNGLRLGAIAMDFSDKYRFADWPDSDLPRVAAGVYAVWDDSRLLYCGMSGRQIEQAIADRKELYGLFTRLRSHASGRLSGDQFCVYVANRLVIPSLAQEDLPRFATGELKLDQLTKAFIHEHLAYQYVVLDSSKAAYELESKARRGEVFGERPLLNPL